MDKVSWSWILLGNRLGDQGKQQTGAEADRLFELAGQKYAEALAIKPDEHNALFNWGVMLGDQAKKKLGPEADRLFELAGKKYAKLLQSNRMTTKYFTTGAMLWEFRRT